LVINLKKFSEKKKFFFKVSVGGVAYGMEWLLKKLIQKNFFNKN